MSPSPQQLTVKVTAHLLIARELKTADRYGGIDRYSVTFLCCIFTHKH